MENVSLGEQEPDNDTNKKEYLPSDWTSDTKVWMVGGAGGGISVRKGVLKILIFD